MSDSDEDEGEAADEEVDARDAAVEAAELDGATVEPITIGRAAGTPDRTWERCKLLSQRVTGALFLVSGSTAEGSVA